MKFYTGKYYTYIAYKLQLNQKDNKNNNKVNISKYKLSTSQWHEKKMEINGKNLQRIKSY